MFVFIVIANIAIADSILKTAQISIGSEDAKENKASMNPVAEDIADREKSDLESKSSGGLRLSKKRRAAELCD